MQLGKNRKKKGVSGRLASAACVLLGGAHAAAEGPKEWEVDTSFLIYSEKDRVTVFEPSISAKKTFANDSNLGLHLVFDTSLSEKIMLGSTAYIIYRALKKLVSGK